METVVKRKGNSAGFRKVLKNNPGVFKRVSDIKVPDILFHPIKTNTPEFDRSFSEIGGVTPSMALLVTGEPGAGKTTLMATLGSRIQSKNPPVFLSYEMSDFQLKMTARKIPGFDEMVVVTKEFHKDKKEFKNFLNDLAEMEPGMIFVDSLQKMAGVMKGSFNQNQIWLTEKFTELAKTSFIPVAMIGHVGKDGTYKGPSTIKHEVDSHMHLFFDKESNERMFQFTKNRFGGVTDPYSFKITGDQIFIGNEYWDQVTEQEGGLTAIAKSAVAEFRAESESSENIPFGSFQKMTTKLFKYLEDKYRNELINDTTFQRNEIKLTWSGARAYCAINEGKINFGEKFFKKVGSNSNWKKCGYKSEKKFIERQCRNKEDMALWVICHEFQHLFKGNQRHNKGFFTKVENMFIREKDIFIS